MDPPQKTILVAVNPPLHAFVRRALSHPACWQLEFAASLDEAKACLQERRCDLIFCSLQFDQSRLFDLLQYVRSHPRTSPIHFVAVKISEGVLSPAGVEAALKAAEYAGADEGVNLAELRIRVGDEQAFDLLREKIAKLLQLSPLST